MGRRLSYSDAGVNRNLRRESKKVLDALKETYRHSRFGRVVELPYGRIFPFHAGYLDLVIEGVGTKVLVAQLADKYDTIGIDGVAMAVNDIIRSGARPLAIADNIHAHVSNPILVKEWMEGILKGAEQSGCLVPSGEIGDVADLIRGLCEGKGFDMVISSIGEVAKEDVIFGNDIKAGDSVIGLRSSGVHSNGISLVRRVLFKQWGGRYEPTVVPEGLDRELVYEVLEPTAIYVRPIMELAGKIHLKGAVHITGDAYLKFSRLEEFSHGIGFTFDNFKPQPIFSIIQTTAKQLGSPISDEEMFKTFNMGWGFAVVVGRDDTEKTVEILAKADIDAERIGSAVRSKGIRILHKNKKIVLH